MSYRVHSSIHGNDGSYNVSAGKPSETKTTYGRRVLAGFQRGDNVTLNHTRVLGEVSIAGNLFADGAALKSINVRGNATLVDTNCVGEAKVEGSLTATRSSIGSIETKGSLIANECKSLGNVRVGGIASCSDCVAVTITAQQVTLNRTRVETNVSVSGQATIRGSSIEGRLTCASNHQVISKSNIGTISLKLALNADGRISSPSSESVGMAGFGPLTVDGMSRKILTEQKSGPGEKKEKDKGIEKEKQILELIDCNVQKIIFDGGDGEVILKGSSQVDSGEITGGKIISRKEENCHCNIL